MHRILSLFMAGFLAGSSYGQAPRPTPPPEPRVPPIVSMPTSADTNGTRVDDRIEASVDRARTILQQRTATPAQISSATAELASKISVELVFGKQITQPQIDAFLKAGGTISKIYTHVSYGWTGEISQEAAVDLPGAMGADFLGVVLKHDAELHLDEAGRTGRVRPTVWNYGVDGNSVGGNRITIAIVDSGVDGTHVDLAGRLEYWRDWTADNHLTPQDIGHHGSHVAGIATGSGAASPAGATTINYSDIGTLPSTVGSFFPSPIHIPTSVPSVNWSSTMRWATGGGMSASLGHVVSNASQEWALLSASPISTVSPISNVTTGFSNPIPGYTNRYSTFATKENSVAGEPEYAIASTVGYAGPGDGYNIFRGVAPGSTWAGLKVFRDDGSGTSVDISEAIDDLVAQNITHQIKVANLSLGIVGSPGIAPTLRNKTNTAAANGVVIVVSAGNDGQEDIGIAGEVDDPGRAQYTITVAASSDINQLTAYSSHGFLAPGDASGGDQDTKPDIVAPGGSTAFQSNIMSIDSNNSDSLDTVGTVLSDFTPNDYYNIQGTSMASPFLAGCAALVIDAMQQRGEVWDFTGAGALADVLRVKMILLATATETNLPREAGPSTNPVLNRGTKDINEGFGIVNPDAAVEAILNDPINASTATASDDFGINVYARRCWARRANLVAGTQVMVTLNVPVSGDYDMYIYRSTPDAYGNPQILSSATAAGLGTDETLTFTPAVSETGYLVVKRVQGNGTWQVSTPATVSAWTLY